MKMYFILVILFCFCVTAHSYTRTQVLVLEGGLTLLLLGEIVTAVFEAKEPASHMSNAACAMHGISAFLTFVGMAHVLCFPGDISRYVFIPPLVFNAAGLVLDSLNYSFDKISDTNVKGAFYSTIVTVVANLAGVFASRIETEPQVSLLDA